MAIRIGAIRCLSFLGAASLSTGNFVEDIGECSADPIDWALCTLFSSSLTGRPCDHIPHKFIEETPEDDAWWNCQEGELPPGTLSEFCGMKFEGDLVIHCPCCADHLMADIRRRAALLMPGEETTAEAWGRTRDGKECREGFVRMYTLGGKRKPSIHCEHGALVCRCMDFHWAEEEVSCQQGDECRPPSLVEEGTAGVETMVREGHRVRTLVDLFYELPKEDRGSPPSQRSGLHGGPPSQQSSAKGAVKVPAGSPGTVAKMGPPHTVHFDDYRRLFPSGNLVLSSQARQFGEDLPPPDDERPNCVEPTSTKVSEGGDIATRMSIGELPCKSMGILQCEHFFALDDPEANTWKLCKRSRRAKECAASAVSLATAEAEADAVAQWAAERVYNPAEQLPGWVYNFRTDQTLRATEAPQWQLQEILTADPDAQRAAEGLSEATAAESSALFFEGGRWVKGDGTEAPPEQAKSHDQAFELRINTDIKQAPDKSEQLVAPADRSEAADGREGKDQLDRELAESVRNLQAVKRQKAKVPEEEEEDEEKDEDDHHDAMNHLFNNPEALAEVDAGVGDAEPDGARPQVPLTADMDALEEGPAAVA